MRHRTSRSYIFVVLAFVLAGAHFSFAGPAAADSTTPPVILSTVPDFITGNSAFVYVNMTTPGYGTIAWIEWDTSTAFSHSTVPRLVGFADGSVSLNELLTGLPQYHLIHLRGAAQFGDLIAYGRDTTFSTGSPMRVADLTTLPADEITSTSAHLHGTARLYGMATSIGFSGGPSYYPFTLGIGLTNGETYEGTAEFDTVISGLVPNMTYTYHLQGSTNVAYAGVELTGGSVTFTTTPDNEAGGLVIPLWLHTPFGSFPLLHFGVHTLATDTLDRPLGEAELPPPPPAGADARFIGKRFGLGTYNDFRAAGDPSRIDTFRISFMADPSVYPVTVTWPSLAALFDGPVTLTYPGGAVDMKTVNEAVITDDAVAGFRIFASGARVSAGPPEAITNDAGNLGASHGLLNGEVNPNGMATTGWFEWGTTASYGSTTAEQPFGLDAALLPASSYIFGLLDGTQYHFRIVARNANGTSNGGDQAFTAAGVTAVPPEAARPGRFSLMQNYPNPANPGTTIQYEVASAASVRLTLYDLLGRKIATLDEGMRTPGAHTVNWDASAFSTGVYFYRLDAAGTNGKIVSAVKKLVIAR